MWYFAWVFVLLAHPLITTTAAFSLFLCSVAPYLSSVQALWCVFESRRPIRGCLPCPEVYCLSLQQQAKPSSHCWQGEWGWWAGVWTSLRKLLQWVAAPPASCRNSGRIIRVKRCTSCPQFEGADHNRQKLLQWLAPPPVSCRYLYSGRIMRVQQWTYVLCAYEQMLTGENCYIEQLHHPHPHDAEIVVEFLEFNIMSSVHMSRS